MVSTMGQYPKGRTMGQYPTGGTIGQYPTAMGSTMGQYVREAQWGSIQRVGQWENNNKWRNMQR